MRGNERRLGTHYAQRIRLAGERQELIGDRRHVLKHSRLLVAG